MRATGIIRRVDDLGRVVIPKEIRKNMRIREGEPLEIFLDGNHTICFRKYQTNLAEDARTLIGEIEDFYEGEDKEAILTLLNSAQKRIQKTLDKQE